MNVYLVWNNWVPLGSPYELTELLGIYRGVELITGEEKAEARLSELAAANDVEYEPMSGIFYVKNQLFETNYYYVETRSVE